MRHQIGFNRAHPVVMARLVGLAALALRLGQVQRATRHPDGARESDTTHTVMLALSAAWLVENVDAFQGLNLEKVLYYAIVHDLPEALTGDINTLRGLSPEERRAKEYAEARAAADIKHQCPELAPWLAAYESGADEEARFVRYLDKIMPKLTHVLDGGLGLRLQGVQSSEELTAYHQTQLLELANRYPELSEVGELFLIAARDAGWSFELGHSFIYSAVAPPRGDEARFRTDADRKYASFCCASCGLLWDALVSIPNGFDAAIQALACPSCRAENAADSLRCTLSVDGAGYPIDRDHPLWGVQ
jgi:5'-deoxynucleotidase YfbR-like HD superfamily hydrolase